jgi:arylsulfatase A-like enzyme
MFADARPIITGRNHHSMGFGVVAEQSTGYPGYNSIMTRDKATIGKILKDNGYNRTSWFGKEHNTPEFQASQAGPFDQWPIGMGFDYFYGFVGGDANQWAPNLFRNTTAIYPYYGHPGWNLITAMADDAIEYLRRITAINSDQPFFVYYVPGAVHAWLASLAMVGAVTVASGPASAQQQKPNILFNHGRRHRLHAAEHLSPRIDGR